MSSFCALLAVLVAFLASPSSAGGGGCTASELARDNMRKLAEANNELALRLHQSLSGHTDGGNVFFSPLSISTAFGMLFYGARGDTAEELRNVLGYNKADLPDELVHQTFKHFLNEVAKNGAPNDDYVLNSANSILVDDSLELVPQYRRDVEDLYQAAVQQVDFARDSSKVVAKINGWVRQKTNGKIEKLLDELDDSTVMVLLNAVYFKGTWKIKFEESRTWPGLFYNRGLGSSTNKVPTMHMKAHFRHAALSGCQALELPYRGDNISMILLLPDRRDGLPDLERELTPEKFAEIRDQLYDTKVIISLPKFKIEYSRELSDDFKKMGASSIFNAGSADLGGLTASRSIAVTQVLHKAVVEVTEEGSEAAAVTGVISNRMKPLFDETPVFNADHPFLFAVVENESGAILFLGRVSEL